MNILKKSLKGVVWGAVLTVAASMFVACGDDSGTGAKDEDSSSSVVEESSSSNKVTEPAEESSSSVAEKESSSSVAKSSSSSSSVIPDPDRGSSSSAKSSSSSKVPEPAEGSSSSAERSSSSEYVPFDHSIYLAPTMTVGPDRYKQFTDERTGRSYYYITITGKDTSHKVNTVTVMAENLNIGEMVRGRKNQEDDSKIERYCYDNDTTYCDKYGGLYQWAEMMALPSECNQKSCADQIKPNHQGICPDGWRLLTYNDMYTIVHADGNEDGIKGARSEYRFGGYNTTGYSLVGAGYLWNYRFANVNTITYWYYPEEGIPTRGGVSSTSNTGTGFELSAVDKTNGLSVRCVKNTP